MKLLNFTLTLGRLLLLLIIKHSVRAGVLVFFAQLSLLALLFEFFFPETVLRIDPYGISTGLPLGYVTTIPIFRIKRLRKLCRHQQWNPEQQMVWVSLVGVFASWLAVAAWQDITPDLPFVSHQMLFIGAFISAPLGSFLATMNIWEHERRTNPFKEHYVKK